MTETPVHFAKTVLSENTYQVSYNNEPILESNQVVLLNEHYEGKDFPSVKYFPKSEIDKLITSDSNLSTTCSIKGDATYLNYKEAFDCIWYYKDPIENVAAIKDHYAFSQKKGFKTKEISDVSDRRLY
mgnify:CR=1 FL=1